jgi:putative oxygen-independent coproporphyrinogen III oxidase
MLPDLLQPWQKGGFALYVHWPFCQAKCPYCDFNSHVAGHVDQTGWLSAYRSEIQRLCAETGGRVLRSIFFGGGTPSLMAPKTVAGIIEQAAGCWTFANDIEITLEANPTSVEAGKFRDFRAAGINRVSIGVQALNDADLRKLGRLHSAAEAVTAIKTAQATFERTSFDLMYARQDQSLHNWERELKIALDMAGDHMSLYQLTIEPETVFGARHALGQLRGLPQDDLAADLYLLTQDLCEGAGLPAYEVSNHARSGAESRHNMVYWNCGDYLGIGPGAHGRLTDEGGGRYATICPANPEDWLRAVESSGSGEAPRERLSRADQATEMLVMGLRVADGISIPDLVMLTGALPDPIKIAELVRSGHVEMTDQRLRVTQTGRMVLNSILQIIAA